MNNLPKNEEDFERLMEEVDAKLKERNLPIETRQLGALREVCKKFGIELKLVDSQRAIPGVYEGDSLSSHIMNWFDRRYGERLKIDYLGSTVLLIKGDPWRIRIPSLLGSFRFVCDRNITNPMTIPRSGVFRHPLINLLHYIENLPPNLIQKLSDTELKDISDFFILSLNALSRMHRLDKKNFLMGARGDLKSSADHIFIQPPNYGLSKWG